VLRWYKLKPLGGSTLYSVPPYTVQSYCICMVKVLKQRRGETISTSMSIAIFSLAQMVKLLQSPRQRVRWEQKCHNQGRIKASAGPGAMPNAGPLHLQTYNST